MEDGRAGQGRGAVLTQRRGVGAEKGYGICRQAEDGLLFVLYAGETPEGELVVRDDIEVHAAKAGEAP